MRHEAILHSSEIALLSVCPSVGSSFHRGMAHLFCHAHVLNEAVTCINEALYQGSNAALTDTEAVLVLPQVSQKRALLSIFPFCSSSQFFACQSLFLSE